MPTTFSSWANRESGSQPNWNGESESVRAQAPELAPESQSASEAASDSSIEELREELATARRRLQYFEGFGPWVEEQMATVVERASEISAENEREQQRVAAEIEHQRVDVDRLTQECARLREEAQVVVADANAAAEDVIGEANTKAAQLMAQAQANAELLVNRLRAEAAAIVSKAVGDLTALEANAVEELTAAPAPVPWAPSMDETERNGVSGEWAATPAEGAQSSVDEAGPESRGDAEPAPEDDHEAEKLSQPAIAQDRPDTADVSDEPFAGEAEPALSEEPGNEDVDSAAETGPFQWLRTALGGPTSPPSTGFAPAEEEEPPAPGALPARDEIPASSSLDDEVSVTRLTIHPALSAPEREEVRRDVQGWAGVSRVAEGNFGEDYFELLVTHQLFTSVLGSLLARAGEHVRLIAQHEDSLEVELTSLSWIASDAATAAARATDA